MSVFEVLICIYLLLKPYYFFSSGGIQIGDYILLIAFVISIILNKNYRKNLIKILKDNYKYVLFMFIVIIVNTIYFILYVNTDFVLYTLYYIYNFMSIVVFSYYFASKKNMKTMSNILKINLIIQLIIYILGFGKYYGVYRYMGTFNDPNQFAYYVLLSFCYIYLVNKTNNKNSIIYLLLSLFLILQSVSTGMLLGIMIFIAIELYNIMIKFFKNYRKNFKYVFVFCYVLVSTIVMLQFVSIFFPNVMNVVNNKLDNIKIVERINSKFNKINHVNKKENIWQERGYDRIIIYPQYILYGAGEGLFTRWDLAYHQGEIHATLPSILFNYGIVACILVVLWMYDKIKKLKIDMLVVYIALIIESFTLINSRQSLFWAIFILGYYLPISGGKNEESK